MPFETIIADENVNFNIIRELRSQNFSVYSILENDGGISDEKVIEITKEKNALLLTEDSDFGEWVFAHNIKNISVLFLRYNFRDHPTITTNVINLLKSDRDLRECFTVLTTKKIRVRRV